MIRLKEKMNKTKLKRGFERERETERTGEEGNCRKGGSLVRHYPQSNPQFQVMRNTERLEKKERQTVMEQLRSSPSPAYEVSNDVVPNYVVSNFSPSVQLSTSGLFTLAGSTERATAALPPAPSWITHHISLHTSHDESTVSLPRAELTQEEKLTLSSQKEGT